MFFYKRKQKKPCEKRTCQVVKNELAQVRKTDPINTNKNNTNQSNTDLINQTAFEEENVNIKGVMLEWGTQVHSQQIIFIRVANRKC